MRTEPVSTAKNRLSALLREVRAGATIVITDRGVPVARLVPVGPTKGLPPRLIDLAQKGLVTLPERAPSTTWLDLPMPKLPPGKSAVDILLEERESGR